MYRTMPILKAGACTWNGSRREAPGR